MDLMTGTAWWELAKHAASWLTNLKRAKQARKRESIDALRKVVVAARRTAVYLRQMRDTGQRQHATESELTTLWTELGYALEDLGIEKLAKRCRITGKYWADPEDMDPVFLDKADVGLKRMEEIAELLLRAM